MARTKASDDAKLITGGTGGRKIGGSGTLAGARIAVGGVYTIN